MYNIQDKEVIICHRNSSIERKAIVYTQKSLVWVKVYNCGLFFISPYDVMRMYDKYSVDITYEYIICSMNDKGAYLVVDHDNLRKIAEKVLEMAQQIVFEKELI